MMFKRCAIATTAVCATVVMLSGCVADGTLTQTPTPAPSLATPTPVTSATPTPTPDAGQAEAAAVVERYIATMDQIAADRTIPLDSLYEAASGEAARAQLQALQQLHVNGYVWTGTTGVEIRDVTGDDAPYLVEACLDTSAITVVDSQGRSVTPDGFPTLTLWRYTVERVSGRLLVMTEEVISRPC